MSTKATIGALSLSTLLVAGCAVPMPLQVASWALDGISYIMTKKSVTDHGISVVAQKDCAVWRGVTAGELCREWQDGSGTLVADKPATVQPKAPAIITAGFAPPVYSDLSPLDANLDDDQSRSDGMMKFVTAVAPVTVPKRLPNVTQPGSISAAPLPKLLVRKRITANVAPKVPKRSTRQAVSASVMHVAARTQPAAGMYFVIGSFRNFGNARTLASRHGTLVPAVLAAKLDGTPVYRVVVGPTVPGREKYLHRRIAKMGLRDTWAIQVQPDDWSIASRVIEHAARVTSDSQLAQSRR